MLLYYFYTAESKVTVVRHSAVYIPEKLPQKKMDRSRYSDKRL